MSYELSFSSEFFFAEGDDHFGGETERPTTVYSALKSACTLKPEWWQEMCQEVFPNVKPDRVDINMVMDKVRETNSCRDIRSPVRVYIDDAGWYSVEVY
jgi:hypothetical protein